MPDLNQWERHILDTYFKRKEPTLTTWFESFSGARDKLIIHIPARSGSSRIKNKNIRMLGNLPLLAYTIVMAKALPVDRVIINTDSPLYAETAVEYGAEAPFLRPAELADDKCPPGLALFYAERFMVDEGYPVKTIIDMYPTTPFRNLQTLRGYVETTRQCGYCCTVTALKARPHDLFVDGKRIDHQNNVRHENSILHKFHSLYLAQSLNPNERLWYEYPVIRHPLELIDIDTESDFRLAEAAIDAGLYDFGIKMY